MRRFRQHSTLRGYPMRITALLLFFALIISPCTGSCSQKGDSPGLTDREVTLLFGEFREVQSFAMIAVSLVGDAEKIGLDAEELTRYAKSQFKNHFSRIRYEDVSKDSGRFLNLVASRDRESGNLTFRVWVVGREYPVVYHIRCDAGNFENPAIYTEEVMGHSSPGAASEAIKTILGEMIREFSVIFFRARGHEM